MIEDFQLPQRLKQLEGDSELAPEVNACRECWKLDDEEPEASQAADEAPEEVVEVKKRKLSSEELAEEKRKREEQRLLHEIRSLGDLLENSDFCVDSLFPDPFQWRERQRHRSVTR